MEKDERKRVAVAKKCLVELKSAREVAKDALYERLPERVVDINLQFATTPNCVELEKMFPNFVAESALRTSTSWRTQHHRVFINFICIEEGCRYQSRCELEPAVAGILIR